MLAVGGMSLKGVCTGRADADGVSLQLKIYSHHR